ncbi:MULTISPECIES: hypothetical protein [Lactobacillus]|uniref:Uncharacterized protein n=1 Tax=Lactobacillus xujianguonis TaxID=2495899 RepID=A0A437SW79_9LACO|nr:MULTISPECIES: hypothetical protein [Lactobacillus]RVU71179.1 hypothetical protein EJK17_02985 [Lactobacillus xujianguonis]
MRKWILLLTKIIMVGLAGFSLYLLLLSHASARVDDTHQMVKTIIHRVVKKSENPELKTAVKIVEGSGMENFLLATLPKKYQVGFSYADVYQLTTNYEEHGKVTAKELHLKSNNRLEDVAMQFLVKEINHQLHKEADQVYHVISVYRFSIFVIILLYILAVIQFILGRYAASISLLIGCFGSFGGLWYFCQEATKSLQNQVYSGIKVTLNPGIWWGLILGTIAGISWLIVLKFLKNKKDVTQDA